MIWDLHKADHRHLRPAHCSPVNVRSPNPRPEYCQLFTGLFWELFALQNSLSTRIMSFSSGWIRLLPAVTGRCKLLDDSVLALYSGFIGRQNNDPAIVYYGMELHGEVLRTMSQDRSWSAESGLKDVEYLLATTKVLSSYELLSTDSGEAYAAHIRGGLQILEKSIHKLPKTSFSRMLIQRFRYIGVGKSRLKVSVRSIDFMSSIMLLLGIGSHSFCQIRHSVRLRQRNLTILIICSRLPSKRCPSYPLF